MTLAALGAAVANGLWQGLVLAAAVLLLGGRLGANARTRCLVWWLAIGTVVALPGLQALSGGWLAAVAPEPVAERRVASRPEVDRLPLPKRPPEFPTETAVAGSVQRSRVADTSRQPSPSPAERELAKASPERPAWTLRVASLALVGLGAGWLLIVALKLARVLTALAGIRRLKAGCCDLADGAELVRRWKRTCATRRPVRVATSAAVASPIALGFRRPMIVLPESLPERLAPGELDLLGLHELAHLKRRDDWTFLLQKLVEALFFFHPGVRLLARRLDFDRELACDDYAIRASGRPEAYARCLLRLLETGDRRTPALLTAGALGSGRNSRRIRMLLQIRRSRTVDLASRPLAAAVAAIGTVAALALAAPPLVGFELSSPGGSGVLHDVWNDRTHLTVRENGRTLELWIRGDVTLLDDHSGVATIAPGGYLKIRERDGLRWRSVRVTPKNGGLDYEYASMGLRSAYDEEARAWFRAVFPEMIDRTGIGAQARAESVLADEGAEALLDLVPTLAADPAKQISLTVLIEGAELSPEQIARAASQVDSEIDAEHRRADLLAQLTDEGFVPSSFGATFFAAVRELESEHRRQELIDHAIQRDGLSDAVLVGYFSVLDALPSEHRRDSLIHRLIEGRVLSFELFLRTLDAIDGLPSEHRRHELLSELAAQPLDDPRMSRELFHALGRLPSEHRRDEMIRRLMARGDDYVRQESAGILDAVSELPSEHRRHVLLLAMLGPLHDDEAAMDRLLELARKLPSEHRVAELFTDLLTYQDLSRPVLERMLDVTKARVASAHRRVRLIEEITDRLLA